MQSRSWQEKNIYHAPSSSCTCACSTYYSFGVRRRRGRKKEESSRFTVLHWVLLSAFPFYPPRCVWTSAIAAPRPRPSSLCVSTRWGLPCVLSSKTRSQSVWRFRCKETEQESGEGWAKTRWKKKWSVRFRLENNATRSSSYSNEGQRKYTISKKKKIDEEEREHSGGKWEISSFFSLKEKNERTTSRHANKIKKDEAQEISMGYANPARTVQKWEERKDRRWRSTIRAQEQLTNKKGGERRTDFTHV